LLLVISMPWALKQIFKWERAALESPANGMNQLTALKELSGALATSEVLSPEKQCELLLRIILLVESGSNNKAPVPTNDNGWILDTSEWYLTPDLASKVRFLLLRVWAWNWSTETISQLNKLFKTLGWAVDIIEFAQTTPEMEVYRIRNRLVHPSSGRVYNRQYNPPIEVLSLSLSLSLSLPFIHWRRF